MNELGGKRVLLVLELVVEVLPVANALVEPLVSLKFWESLAESSLYVFVCSVILDLDHGRLLDFSYLVFGFWSNHVGHV